MLSFLRVLLAVFLFSFYEQGNATRYLPMIVWDHLNPMLSCKQNWFHPMAKLEFYDQLHFVCPTLIINVKLLDRSSRPKDQMNMNIFMRKSKGSIDDLKKSMEDGSFCDPNHADTKKLATCRNGKEGEAYKVMVSKDQGYFTGDIVVFFNNADDGRANSLTSPEKRCAMALVANITWESAIQYDFSYDKNVNDGWPECNDNSKTHSTPTTATTTSRRTSTINRGTISTLKRTPTTTTKTTAATTTTTTKVTAATTLGGPESLAQRGASEKEEWDKFLYGFLTGIGSLLFIFVIGLAIYYVFCSAKRKKRTKTSCSCAYKTNGDCIVNNLNSAEPLPKKSRNPERGINNHGFHGTLKRDNNS